MFTKLTRRLAPTVPAATKLSSNQGAGRIVSASVGARFHTDSKLRQPLRSLWSTSESGRNIYYENMTTKKDGFVLRESCKNRSVQFRGSSGDEIDSGFENISDIANKTIEAVNIINIIKQNKDLPKTCKSQLLFEAEEILKYLPILESKNNEQARIERILEVGNTYDLLIFISKLRGEIEALKIQINNMLSYNGYSEYQEFLEKYRRARATKSRIEKIKFFNIIKNNIAPRMHEDIAYFSMISFFLSYINFEVPQMDFRIPFTPIVFRTLQPNHQSVLNNTKEMVLIDWLMQTGGDQAGIKFKIWEGRDKNNTPSNFYIVDSMGTNSLSTTRDHLYSEFDVVTGSKANGDKKGIAFSAFDELRGVIKRKLANLPSDAVIVMTGHSLGASVAARCYKLLFDEGYKNVHLIAFNGGALCGLIPENLRAHAALHATHILNNGDPVPFGGDYLLPGLIHYYPLSHPGTIAGWNLAYGYTQDPIRHGDPQHFAGYLSGFPTKFEPIYSPRPHVMFLHRVDNVARYSFSGARKWTLEKVLKPAPKEHLKTNLSWTERSKLDE